MKLSKRLTATTSEDWDTSDILAISEHDARKNHELDLGEGKRKYSFGELIERCENFNKVLEQNWFKQYCFSEQLIPFACLRDRDSLSSWLGEYVGYALASGKEYKSVDTERKTIESLFSNWFNFEIPVLTLENKSFAEVAEIFERINRTGVQLSVFALATAVFYKQGIKLRDLWKNYYNNDENEITGFCSIDNEEYPKFILQIIALLKGKDVKKNVLINPKVFKFNATDWKEACSLLDKAFMRAKNTVTGYGVFRSEYLPYKTILVSLAALLKKARNADDFHKIDSWYWSCVVTGRYAGSSDTAIKQDFDDVSEWLSNDNKKPSVVLNAQAEIDNLSFRKVMQGGLYKAILTVIALKSPKDFYTGQSVELSTLNDHHIFPKKSGLALEDENSILNRTLISEVTNKSILNKKPSSYLDEMKSRLRNDRMITETLDSHLISSDAQQYLSGDNYTEFIITRENSIKSELKALIFL